MPDNRTPDRLPLDDPMWATLQHRGGTGPTDEVDVAAELAALLAEPRDVERFKDLWPYLASEDTTWPAAWAALPYVVDLAAAQPADDRAEALSVIGLILTGGRPSEIPEALAGAARAALRRTYALIGDALPHLDSSDLAYVLGTIAALRGNSDLALVLQGGPLEATCDECGAEVWVELPVE